MKYFKLLCILLLFQSNIFGQKPRARDIGIPFKGLTGKFNTITDVKGVEVGYSTTILGQGKNVRGKGPVRTGVTAILPRGRNNNPVVAETYDGFLNDIYGFHIKESNAYKAGDWV